MKYSKRLTSIGVFFILQLGIVSTQAALLSGRFEGVIREIDVVNPPVPVNVGDTVTGGWLVDIDVPGANSFETNEGNGFVVVGSAEFNQSDTNDQGLGFTDLNMTNNSSGFADRYSVDHLGGQLLFSSEIWRF